MSNFVCNIIVKIREYMKKNNIAYYIASDVDPHMSEYVNEHYKVRSYLSGFTGSNGTLIIGLKECFLWTDGRYFVQARHELKDSGIGLMEMGQAGVPTIVEYFDKVLKKGDNICLDGLTISISFGKNIEKVAARHDAIVTLDSDFIDNIWTDRPLDSSEKIWKISDKDAGESSSNKLKRVRDYIKASECDYLFLSKLEDQMWLYNIRGNDIECNPVCYCFSLIGLNETICFLKISALTSCVKKRFDSLNIKVIDYSKMPQFISKISGEVILDKDYNSFGIYWIFNKKCNISFFRNITEDFKAVKNETEIENIKKCYLDDSVVLTKFIMKLKQEGLNAGWTETYASKILDNMRSEIPGFIELSFPTISAYGSNAAMMHYEAKEGMDSKIYKRGFYLIDSGGQYKNGTTDVTRTIVCGKISSKMKEHFTKVCVGMLRLLNATFMKGCTGRNLDILARGELWKDYIDYKCGTGHGVGYILSVHEGPHSIRYARRKGEEETVFLPGMIVSDEPGVYIADKYGIRTENILLCINKAVNSDGTFLGFTSLTKVPIDLDAIDVKYMNENDIKLLNAYHKDVYESLKCYFRGDELKWLRKATYPIKKDCFE